MDELRTWRDVAKRVRWMGRGAQTRMAAALDIDPSYFSKLLRSPKELTLSELERVEAFVAGVPIPVNDDAPRPEPERSGRKLKVFGFAAASDGDLIALADDRVLDYLELPPGMDLDPDEYFVVLPIGSSMEPRVYAGEPQIIRRNYPPARDKKCIIEFSDGTAVIKSYRGQRDGRVFGEQYNPPKVLDYDATSVKALHAVWFSL